jgi:hypothetical protein
MKNFFSRHSYDMVKMFLNQFAIAIFGFVLTLVALKANSPALRNAVGVGAVAFYLFLLYTMTWDVGYRDKVSTEAGMIGIGWATSGGEASALFNDSYLAADGIENVNRVLDQIENGNIPPLEFVELCACTGGCVGGVMTIQNPFIAKARLQNLRRYLPVSQNFLKPNEQYIPEHYFFNEMPEYRGVAQLGSTMAESMRMMADIQSLRGQLPGLDCGSCGAPSCRAFAEDVVQGNAKMSDCMLTMREQVRAYLAEKEASHDGK